MRKAMTLMELLFVITILGAVLWLSAPMFRAMSVDLPQGHRAAENQAQLTTFLKTLRTDVEAADSLSQEEIVRIIPPPPMPTQPVMPAPPTQPPPAPASPSPMGPSMMPGMIPGMMPSIADLPPSAPPESEEPPPPPPPPGPTKLVIQALDITRDSATVRYELCGDTLTRIASDSPETRSWQLPKLCLSWKICHERGRPYALEVQAAFNLVQDGVEPPRLSNSNVFFLNPRARELPKGGR